MGGVMVKLFDKMGFGSKAISTHRWLSSGKVAVQSTEKMEDDEDDHTIACCVCGTQIRPNPANTCINCLKAKVDITEGIPKQAVLLFCRNCERYQRPPWTAAELESKELLAICLKKINFKNVKLKDASFQWTEPHSRRVKVRLTIQKEVYTALILQQTFIVEFVVTPTQCPDCAASFTGL
eukprot:g10147.t1